jgi:hypothetical protein
VTGLARPLIKWFGSKWQSCKYYPEPNYDVIIEPFAGGAAYSCRHPNKQVILFDIDPELIALWNWLIVADPVEILSLPVQKLELGRDLRSLGLRPEAADLIRRWQRVGRNDCWTVSKWNNTPGQWAETVKRSICESLPRIRHWKAFHLNYTQIPPSWPAATWFVDPPYQHVKGYRFESVRYWQLVECVQAWSVFGQVIVCEQQGADWLPFRSSHEVTGGRTKQGGTRAKSKEVVWLGGS